MHYLKETGSIFKRRWLFQRSRKLKWDGRYCWRRWHRTGEPSGGWWGQGIHPQWEAHWPDGARTKSKIKTPTSAGHATDSLSPLAISMGPAPNSAEVVAPWDVQRFFRRSSLPPTYAVLLPVLQHTGALSQEQLSSSRWYLRRTWTLQSKRKREKESGVQWKHSKNGKVPALIK